MPSMFSRGKWGERESHGECGKTLITAPKAWRNINDLLYPEYSALRAKKKCLSWFSYYLFIWSWKETGQAPERIHNIHWCAIFFQLFFFLGPAAKEPSNCISKSSELKRQFRDLALWPIFEGKYKVFFLKKKTPINLYLCSFALNVLGAKFPELVYCYAVLKLSKQRKSCTWVE